MPRTKSAKKTLKASTQRRVHNLRRLRRVRQAVKKSRQQPEPQALAYAFKQIDKAAKRGLIHKNTAARLKSRLSRKIPTKN